MKLDTISNRIAVKAIAKFGKAVTLIRVVEGAYNVATSSTTNVETSSTIKAIIEEYKGFDFSSGFVQQGDKKITVAASGLVAPAMADKITIDGITFVIVGIQTVIAGSSVVLYILQGRKA